MADSKITALTSISTSTDPANDPLVIVDVSDTSMAATGTTKKVTLNQLLGASGTATLASATITGDLTVDTSTLKVDSANNRVGIGTASPAVTLDISDPSAVIRATSSTGTNTSFAAFANTGGAVRVGAENSAGGGLFTGSSAYSAVLGTTGAYSAHIGTNATVRYSIASDGVATWSNVGGVAGTAMTLNSTGLGVGRSPSYRLQASSGTKATTASLATVAGITTTDADDFGIYFRLKTDATGANRYAAITSFDNGNGARDLVLQDLGGNVGIGITPKPWRSGARALQLGANGYVSLHEQSNGNANLCFAAYEGSANVFNYTTTGDLPSRYVLVSGTHQWYTAPSGTAGNAITFTEVMRLDASGNLILLPSNTPPSLGTNGQLTVNATSNTNLRFSYRGSDGVTRVANLTLA